MITVFANAKCKPNCAVELRAILEKLVKASRAEAGVMTYEVFETNDGGEFLFREEYVDAEAFESHRQSRHVQVAMGRAAPILNGGLTVWLVNQIF